VKSSNMHHEMRDEVVDIIVQFTEGKYASDYEKSSSVSNDAQQVARLVPREHHRWERASPLGLSLAGSLWAGSHVDPGAALPPVFGYDPSCFRFSTRFLFASLLISGP